MEDIVGFENLAINDVLSVNHQRFLVMGPPKNGEFPEDPPFVLAVSMDGKLGFNFTREQLVGTQATVNRYGFILTVV